MRLLLFAAFGERSIPPQFTFNNISCEINDGTGMSCENFISQAPSVEKCFADIKFNFDFTNVGLACVNITDIRVVLGPEGRSLLSFDSIHPYHQRQFCVNESWVIPDKRSNVNLCEESVDPWEISIEVFESRDQSVYHEVLFELIPLFNSDNSNTPVSTAYEAPSYRPSTAVSQSPSIDTCRGCTLTSLVSFCKYQRYY